MLLINFYICLIAVQLCVSHREASQNSKTLQTVQVQHHTRENIFMEMRCNLLIKILCAQLFASLPNFIRPSKAISYI